MTKVRSDVCQGGGTFGLRPLRTSNSVWMSAGVSWGTWGGPLGVWKTVSEYRRWAAKNTVASGNFRLWGNLLGSCGPPHPGPDLKFQGQISY